MSELPRFHVDGEPILYSRGGNGPVVLTSSDPRFPPREDRSTAPAPNATPRSEYPSRRLVAQATTLSSPAAALMPLAPAIPPSHRPAARKVPLAGTARTGRRPASTPDSRTDHPAPPCADATDTWHDTSAMMCYPPAASLNTQGARVVTFLPTHGPGLVGVALTELLCGRGVVDPNAPLAAGMPAHYSAGAPVSLVLVWPGYHNTHSFPLCMEDDQGRSTTRAGLGQQIARQVYYFMKHFGDSDPFTPGGARLRLGLTGIRFERLRLLEAIFLNGYFSMRLGFVPPPGHTAA